MEAGLSVSKRRQFKMQIENHLSRLVWILLFRFRCSAVCGSNKSRGPEKSIRAWMVSSNEARVNRRPPELLLDCAKTLTPPSSRTPPPTPPPPEASVTRRSHVARYWNFFADRNGYGDVLNKLRSFQIWFSGSPDCSGLYGVHSCFYKCIKRMRWQRINCNFQFFFINIAQI